MLCLSFSDTVQIECTVEFMLSYKHDLCVKVVKRSSVCSRVDTLWESGLR